MKKTIILMWNPYFSSYKMEQFEDELHHLHLGMITDYNWSSPASTGRAVRRAAYFPLRWPIPMAIAAFGKLHLI